MKDANNLNIVAAILLLAPIGTLLLAMFAADRVMRNKSFAVRPRRKRVPRLCREHLGAPGQKIRCLVHADRCDVCAELLKVSRRK